MFQSKSMEASHERYCQIPRSSLVNSSGSKPFADQLVISTVFFHRQQMCVDLLQEVFVLLAGVGRLNSAIPSLRSFQGRHVAHDVSHGRNGAHKYIQASVFQILESQEYGVVCLDLDAGLVFLPNVFIAGAAYLDPDALADDIVRLAARPVRPESRGNPAVKIRLREIDPLRAVRRVDHSGDEQIHPARGESGNDSSKIDGLERQFYAHAPGDLVA